MKKILLACALLHNIAMADELTREDVIKEAAFATMLIVDYGQTRSINGFCDHAQHYCEMHETNPLLGPHPGDARMRNYFAGVAVTHVAVTYLLPLRYRATWQNSSIIVEGAITARNARLGLRVKF